MYKTDKTVERIKLLAKQKDIKITTLLSGCELNKNSLSSMMSRGSWLQSNSLAKIADYLDCSVDYLLGRTDNLNSHKPQVINNVNGNYNAVGSDNSVMINKTILDEHQKLLIELYNKLTPIEQIDLIAQLNNVNKQKHSNN